MKFFWLALGVLPLVVIAIWFRTRKKAPPPNHSPKVTVTWTSPGNIPIEPNAPIELELSPPVVRSVNELFAVPTTDLPHSLRSRLARLQNITLNDEARTRRLLLAQQSKAPNDTIEIWLESAIVEWEQDNRSWR